MCALYPSLNQIETAAITANAVRDSNVYFQDISYDELTVYLALTIGKEGMNKWGVGHCYPKKLTDDDQLSLNSKINRNMMNWECLKEQYSEDDKKNLLAAMIQVATLVLMQTSCYAFGGKIFLQLKGSGIGLRASACEAKLVQLVSININQYLSLHIIWLCS